jgi:hypothetical protein
MTVADPGAEDGRSTPRISLPRILNVTANALITIAVIGETLLSFLLLLKGQAAFADQPQVLQFVMSPIAVAPGVALAFIKFLLNVIRAFRSAAARINVVVFGLIVVWPLLLLLAFEYGHSKALSVSSAAPASSDGAERLVREEHESAQYLKAYDWAMDRGLTSLPECPRATDAYRGCQAAVLEHRAALVKDGIGWAQRNRPARASDCQGQANFVLGCRRYYLEHLDKPKPAGQGRYEGMTTAECEVEVNASYEVARELYLQEGNTRGAAVYAARTWGPDLRDCENYDKVAQSKWMPVAYNRLQVLIDRMKAGGTVSEDEQEQVRKDFSAMAEISDQPYRAAYLKNADEYFSLLDGSYRKPRPNYARMSCAAFQKKIDELVALDATRAAAMRALKRSDGVVSDGAKYNAINQQRIDMLWEWKYATDGAKAAKCEITSRSGGGEHT